VKTNGNLTKYFPVKNSVKQGCPISALLFSLRAEPLCSAIKNNNVIEGITIPVSEKTSVIFQHADDTTLTVSNKSSIFASSGISYLYSKSTGAKINVETSEIMCFGKGSLTQSDKNRIKFSVCERVIKVLGVYLGTDQNKCELLNWKDKVSTIKSILGLWYKRNLTIQGRSIVLNSLIMSKLWYTLSVCPIPVWARQDIQTACLKCLWYDGAHLVSYKTIINAKSDGGLSIPDIHLKMLAFRLKFRFFNMEI